MTSAQRQDFISTPVTEHLTPVQKAILNKAVSVYQSAREHVAKWNGSRASVTEHLSIAGTATGMLQYGHVDTLDASALAEIRMALQHVQRQPGDAPLEHFMTAIVTYDNDQVTVASVKVLDLTELFNRVVEVEYRYNYTSMRSICPLSNKVFKPHLENHAFLAGTLNAVFEDILPPDGRVEGDNTRACWTVGELQAYMTAQWHAARENHKLEILKDIPL